jgi:large subunit ribosomal protein L25
MSDYILEAEVREQTGKAHTRRLRHAGKLPGIIYGGGKPDLPIILDYNDTAKIMLRDEGFYTSMLEVKVKGKRGKNTVLLKATQWCSIYDTPQHLDFLRVDASDSVHVSVPVHAINTESCPGVKEGGRPSMIRHELEVVCRADSIPENIEIDCSDFVLDQTIHIDDITLPEGVEVPHEVNFTVMSISAPKIQAEPTAEEIEAAAGAVAETEADAASTDGDKEA